MIKCVKFRPFKKGHIVGFADIFVEKWGIHIKGCTMFHKEGRSWIAFPAKDYTDDEGKKCYSPIIRFETKEHQEAFSKACVEEINKSVEKEPENIPEFL